MKSEILEKNRELLLLIFNLSGIKNIKLEKIKLFYYYLAFQKVMVQFLNYFLNLQFQNLLMK